MANGLLFFDKEIHLLGIWIFALDVLKDATREARFQFERHGYFMADRVDSKPGAPVFNRTVTLRDSWTRPGAPR